MVILTPQNFFLMVNGEAYQLCWGTTQAVSEFFIALSQNRGTGTMVKNWGFSVLMEIT